MLIYNLLRGCSWDIHSLTEAGECTPRVVTLQVVQVSASGWQIVLILHIVDLSLGLLKWLHDMATGDPRDTEVEPDHVFSYLALKATLIISTTLYWFHTSALFNTGEKY